MAKHTHFINSKKEKPWGKLTYTVVTTFITYYKLHVFLNHGKNTFINRIIHYSVFCFYYYTKYVIKSNVKIIQIHIFSVLY